jgi:uncharacterized protein YbbC (DUF1343 family)
MTAGEIAMMFNQSYNIKCKLNVVQMQGWWRSMWFDETGLSWVNPSPNMRNTTQALLYPGIGLLEACNVSVGRGTDQPFEQIGAPWIDGRKLAARLNGYSGNAGASATLNANARSRENADAKAKPGAGNAMAGLRFVPITFVPDASMFKGESCGGVYIIVVDRKKVRPVQAGLAIAWQLNQLFGSQFEPKGLMRMAASQRVYERVLTSRAVEDIVPLWQTELKEFKAARQPFLLYK